MNIVECIPHSIKFINLNSSMTITFVLSTSVDHDIYMVDLRSCIS